MRATLIITLLLAAPRAALACPVCFGQSDSPLAWGVNMGVFLMLAVTGGVLAAFATFFIHLMRRARLAADPVAGPAQAGHYPRAAEEGTAQC